MCLDYLAEIEDVKDFTSLLYDDNVVDPVFKRQLEVSLVAYFLSI